MIFQSPDIFGGEGTLLIGKEPKVFYLKVRVEGVDKCLLAAGDFKASVTSSLTGQVQIKCITKQWNLSYYDSTKLLIALN